MPIPLGILAATASGGIPTFEHIGTTTLGTAATTITFSSIPQTFRHLHLRVYAKNSTTPTAPSSHGFDLRINNDATSGRYGWQRYYVNADGGSPIYEADITSEAGAEAGRSMRSGTGTTNKWMPNLIDIYDYTNTSKMTTFKSFSGFPTANSELQVNLYTGYYNQLAAVSSITLLSLSNNFVVGTTIALYGLAG